jgi:cyclohexa-1,5-dienecarbonyl-CoA hydratase
MMSTVTPTSARDGEAIHPGGIPADTGPTYRFLRVESAAGIVRLTLSQPPVNVLTLDMLEELAHALAAVSSERSIKLLVLRGEGRAFCAGVDVADHTAERVEGMLTLFHGVILRLLAMECPTLVVVHGATLGGGCELMLACDLAVAREDAKIGQPEIRLGVFPPVAAALLPARIGRQRAMDLVLTGRTLDAWQAHAAGLVSEVLPVEDFDGAVTRYVDRLGELSGPVLRVAKRALRAGQELPPRDAIARAEALYLNDLLRLEDAEEGLRAFLEKRAPVWKEA